MARVRMLGTISGPRAGQDWPRRGGLIDVPDDEAAALVAMRMAEYAPQETSPQTTSPEPTSVESAAVDLSDAETAAAPRPRARTSNGGARR